MYHPRAAAGVTLESDSEKQETASQSSMSGEPTEVEAWLFTIDRGLLQYAPIFKAHEITSLSVLGELTDEDIKADIEPGIKFAGHRVLLRRALSDLRARQATGPGLSISYISGYVMDTLKGLVGF